MEEKDDFMITLMTECRKSPEICDVLKTLRRFERCHRIGHNTTVCLDIIGDLPLNIGDLPLDFMNMQLGRNPPY